MSAPPPFELRTHGSIRELGQATYERLLPPDRPPFLSFAWLDALRPSRWPRSLLIFAPLLALGVPALDSLVALYCAFCALGLVAGPLVVVGAFRSLAREAC